MGRSNQLFDLLQLFNVLIIKGTGTGTRPALTLTSTLTLRVRVWVGRDWFLLAARTWFALRSADGAFDAAVTVRKTPAVTVR
jgi:hypothetical protein